VALVPGGALSQKSAKDGLRKICKSRPALSEHMTSTNLGKLHTGSQILEASRATGNVVIYLLFPSALEVLSTIQSIIALHQLLQINSSPSKMIIHPLPMSIITGSLTSSRCSAQLNELAFSIYDRLPIQILQVKPPPPETFTNLFTHPPSPTPIRLFQSPAFVVSPRRHTVIEFDLKWPVPSLEILHRHRLLHAVYDVVPSTNCIGHEWIVVSVIDESGESWKTVPKLLKARSGIMNEKLRLKEVWKIVQSSILKVNVEWRVVISRYGLMSKLEIEGERFFFLLSVFRILITSRR
jgi:hypothetical protein